MVDAALSKSAANRSGKTTEAESKSISPLSAVTESSNNLPMSNTNNTNATNSQSPLNAGGGSSIRQDMIDTAERFMISPNVRNTSIEQQKTFLKKKGLTDEEIRIAVDRAMSKIHENDRLSGGNNFNGQMQLQPVMQMQTARSKWHDLANVMVMMGGLTYGCYWLCRKIILPKLFNVPDPDLEMQRRVDEQLIELHNSVRFMMDSVQQTLNAVNTQQDSLNKALTLLGTKDGFGVHSNEHLQRQMNEMRSDVALIKGLMLSRNQFAPLPGTNGLSPANSNSHSSQSINTLSANNNTTAALTNQQPASSTVPMNIARSTLPAWQQQATTVNANTHHNGTNGVSNGHSHMNDSLSSNEDDNDNHEIHNAIQNGNAAGDDRKISTPV